MTAHINFSKDKNKLFASFEVNIKQLSSAEQVVLECECTDFLQGLLDYCNSHFFKNFKLNLEMEDT
jgi:hypothetical protein